MSAVIQRVREKYPQYSSIPDNDLAIKIGEKYPQYLKDEEFSKEFEAAGGRQMTELGRVEAIETGRQRLQADTSAAEQANKEAEPGILGKTADTLRQAGIGIAKGFPEVGMAAYGAASGLSNFVPMPPEWRKSIVSYLDQTALNAKALAQELEQVGQETEGSGFARSVGSGAISMLPAVVAARGGLGAAALVSGLQSFGSSYVTKKEYLKANGFDESEASVSALAPALASGIITSAATKYIPGGLEGWTQLATKGGLKQVMKEISKAVGLEFTEETADQVGQSFIDKLTDRPDLDAVTAMKESLEAGAVGAIVGGAAKTIGLAQPVPESKETIQAQINLTKDPNSSKSATLVTRPELPPAVTGLEPIQTSAGVVLVNPDKADPKVVAQVVEENRAGKVLGMSQETKPEGNLVVQTKDKEGTVIQDEVVTPEGIDAAIEAGKKLSPEGTTEVKAAEQVVQERKEGDINEQVRNEEEGRETPLTTGEVSATPQAPTEQTTQREEVFEPQRLTESVLPDDFQSELRTYTSDKINQLELTETQKDEAESYVMSRALNLAREHQVVKSDLSKFSIPKIVDQRVNNYMELNAPKEKPSVPPTKAGQRELNQGVKAVLKKFTPEERASVEEFIQTGKGRLDSKTLKTLKESMEEQGVTPEDVFIPEGPGAATRSDVGSQKERKFSKRFDETEEIEKETREKTGNRFYDPRSNEETNFMVNWRIERQGEMAVYEQILRGTDDIPGEEHVAGTINLTKRWNEKAKQLDSQGKKDEANTIRDRIAALIEVVTEREGTLKGRTIQAFRMWSVMTPEGMLRAYVNSVRKSRETKAGKKAEKKASEAASKLNEINKEKVGEAIENVKAPKAKEQAVLNLWQRYKKDAVDRVIYTLSEQEISKSPPLKEFVDRLKKTLSQSAQEVSGKPAKTEGMSDMDTLKEVLNNQEKYQEVIDQTLGEIKERYADQPEMLEFYDQVFETAFGKPFSNKLVSGVVGSIIQKSGFNLQKLASDFDKKPGTWTEARKEIENIFRGLGTPYDEIVPDMMKQVDILFDSARSKPPKAPKTAVRVEGKEPEQPSQSLWDQYREGAANALLNRLKSSVNKPVASLDDFTKKAIKAVSEAIPRGPTQKVSVDPRQEVVEAMKNPEKYRAIIDALTSKATVLDSLIGEMYTAPFSRKAFGKLAASTVSDVVRKHYSEGQEAGVKLSEKLVSEAGLSGTEAEYYSNAIQDEFNRLTREAKEKALKVMLKDSSGVERKVLTEADKIILLSNLGGLTSNSVLESVAKKIGLQTADPEVMREIQRRMEEAQSKPEGFQRDFATVRVMDYIANQKGINKADLAMAWWYASILSSPVTQGVNLTAGFTNVIAESAVQMALNPKAVPQILSNLYTGLVKGFPEAKAILATGDITRRAGARISTSPALELIKDSPKPFLRLLSQARYIQRMMAAADMLNYKASEEMKAYLLARDLAMKEGLSGKELTQKVSRVLHNTDELKAQALDQAKSEGLSGYQLKRRVNELVESGRPADVNEEAANYALRATFNQDPQGAVGMLAKGLNRMGQMVPPVKLIVPFTNIVANVLNAQLDYTPYGYKRAFMGHSAEGKWFSRENAPEGEAFSEQMFKATAGTLGLIVLAALTQGDKDDKPVLEISAVGPKDSRERYQLMETGWRPHSIKIGDRWVSYLNSPLAVGLAMVGNYRDGQKYNKLDEEELGTRLAFTAWNGVSVVFNQSFLTGLADFLSSLQNKGTTATPDSIGRFLARGGSAFIMPNAVKWIDKAFDPEVKQAKTITEFFIREIPVARSTQLKPILNVLGEPVRKEGLARFGSERFWSDTKSDPLWDLIVEKQAWISIPSKNSKIGDRTMTQDEYYEYVQTSGRAIANRLRPMVDELKGMTQEDAEKRVDKIVRDERDRARKEIRNKAIP